MGKKIKSQQIYQLIASGDNDLFLEKSGKVGRKKRSKIKTLDEYR